MSGVAWVAVGSAGVFVLLSVFAGIAIGQFIRGVEPPSGEWDSPFGGRRRSRITIYGYQPTISKEEADRIRCNPPSGGSSVMPSDESRRN